MTSRDNTELRVKTGIAAGAVFVALITLGGMLGVTFVTAFVTLVMAWELAQIFFTLPDKQEKRKVLLGAAWLMVFINFLAPRSLIECLTLAVMLLFAYYLATAVRHEMQLKEHFQELMLTVFALIYPISFMTFLPLLRTGAHGLQWTMLYFVVIWTVDTGAYFAGRHYGGRKLYPVISPGKTVSGAIGGLVAAFVVTLLYKLIFFRDMHWFAVLLVPVSVGIVSQMGDLCESMLKRAYGIKDSGHILPGHGGMLDRFDGALFALPIMYFCVKAFG